MYQMVHQCHVDVQVHTRADAHAVYALIRDGASWPAWTSIDSFELERPGAPDGVGAIWIFRKGRVTGRDQVTEVVPDQRFSYRNLSGLPVRDYRAEVDLEPADAGTRIRWRVSFTPRLPGTGRICQWALGRFIRRNTQGLAAYAPTTTLRER